MLELQTFGGLELRTGDGERVEALAGRTKCLALLAYLAVEAPEGRVPREKVAPLLWPDRTDERSRASLRVALSQIRQATDPALVAGEGTSSLGLVRDHLRADVTRFRDALEAGEKRQALELYTGEFLAGVHVEGARPFLRWADRKRGQLRQQAYEAALSVGASARETGDMAAAEDAFRQALDLGPLREEAAQKLIRTLADRGRPADALQLYEAFRQRREAELDLAPSEELQQWVEELKRAPPAASDTVEEAGRASDPDPGGRPSDEADTSAVEPAERPAPASGAPRGREPSRREGFRRRGLLGALLAAALLGGLLAGAWHLLSDSDGTAAAAAGDRSVAVLPFEAIGTEDPGPIAEGLHRDLLTRLSSVSGLEVISATSVERFRATDLPLPAIADSLGVTWVVEGDVQQAGDALKLNAQLIDPRTDTHAWAESYRRDLSAQNLFELQTEISTRIARALEARVSRLEQERIERQPTGDLQAYRLYLQGRGLLAQRTDASTAQAVEYFRRALARDSSYALAWSGLADAVGLRRTYGYGVDSTLDVHPADAARRALAIDSSLAEAHASLGQVYARERNGPAALRQLRRAVQLKPSYATAHHWLGFTLATLGRPGKAVGHLEQAVELNPLSPVVRLALADCYYWNGQFEASLREVRKLGASGEPLGAAALEGIALSALGRQQEAVTALQIGVERDVSPTYRRDNRAWLAVAHARGGDTARARTIISELRSRPHDALRRVFPTAALGKVDAAVSALEDARLPARSFLIPFVRYDRVLKPVRGRAEYREFLRQVNRVWGLDPDGSLPEGTGETPR